MNVEYCTHCGHKNIYSAVAPNFCAGCGTPLRGGNQAARQPIQESVAEETTETVPHLSKLSYDVEIDTGNKKVTLGDIMREGVRTYGEDGPPTEGSSIPGRQSNATSAPLSREDILKQGLDSCKSARGQPSQDVE